MRASDNETAEDDERFSLDQFLPNHNLSDKQEYELKELLLRAQSFNTFSQIDIEKFKADHGIQHETIN